MSCLLYIDIKFPSVTGTFVYREIEALRDAGYDITTVSMAKPIKRVISAEAQHFLDTTIYLNQVGLFKKIYAQLKILFKNPLTWIRLFLIALREKEIRKKYDRHRILFHFILAGYLFWRFKDRSFDHIHSPFLTGSANIAFFLSQYLKIPFSFTMHASNIYINPLMLETKLQSCKKAVTVSQYNKEFLLHKYGNYLDNKIHIIHCGINVEVFRPVKKEKILPPIVLSIGQLMERKGFIYLLEACNLLKKKIRTFRCLIVGGDGDIEYRKRLISLKESLEVCDVVTLMGRQPQERVRELLHDSSIFVLPSIITDEGGREGIPVALMEAMAMELPVISTRTVGIPELIEHKVDGLLVEQKNPEDLADALQTLLSQKQLRYRLGRAARRKIIREFNIDHTSTQFGELFR
jgi:glycosyltransferase involved in cell wall biosynthesis